MSVAEMLAARLGGGKPAPSKSHERTSAFDQVHVCMCTCMYTLFYVCTLHIIACMHTTLHPARAVKGLARLIRGMYVCVHVCTHYCIYVYYAAA